MTWDDLSMAQRAAYIREGVRNNIINLDTIKDTYNKYIEQGHPIKIDNYKDWAKALSQYWNEDISSHDYDYEKYYNDNPKRAIAQLKNILMGGKSHFEDSGVSGSYKKSTHPTYPDLGEASWSNNDTIFHLSDRQALENTDRILDYLGEDLDYNNGATKVMYQDSYVLPTVNVTPEGGYSDLVPNELLTGWVYSDSPRAYNNKFSEGGFTDGNSPVYPQYVPEGYTPYQGEIRQAPTTSERIIYKAKDIGRAVAAFVPFLGTALDFYDDNMEQVPTGAVGDAADVLNYGSGKLSEYADNIDPNQTQTITVGRGKHRHKTVVHRDMDKALNKGLSRIGTKAAKGLGLIGYAIDTPNMVSDIENLKRALGFNYNEGLILK